MAPGFTDCQSLWVEFCELLESLARNNTNDNFVVKIHPSDYVERWRPLTSLSNVIFTEGDLGVLINKSLSVITNGSTIEFMVLAKGVLSLAAWPVGGRAVFQIMSRVKVSAFQ